MADGAQQYSRNARSTILYCEMNARRRSRKQKLVDFCTFPIRALLLFHEDRFGLSSLRTERFDYVAREVTGRCLDIGCGRGNRFVTEFLSGHGLGIDVFPYEGLTPENLVTDLSQLPFGDESFETVTFIACLNHCPRSQRDSELREAFRVLRPGGRIIITMGNWLAEVLVHQLVRFYDKFLGTSVDVDGERGMHEEEDYFLTDREIKARLDMAGFVNIRKKYFATQWALNHMFIAQKPAAFYDLPRKRDAEIGT